MLRSGSSEYMVILHIFIQIYSISVDIARSLNLYLLVM